MKLLFMRERKKRNHRDGVAGEQEVVPDTRSEWCVQSDRFLVVAHDDATSVLLHLQPNDLGRAVEEDRVRQGREFHPELERVGWRHLLQRQEQRARRREVETHRARRFIGSIVEGVLNEGNGGGESELVLQRVGDHGP